MDGEVADRPTPAINGVGGTSSGAGRRPGFNLFSGPVCAAVFVSFALCIVVFCVYSFLARRRAISAARGIFIRHISKSHTDLELGRLARLPVPPPPPVATTPPPAATTVSYFDVPLPPQAASACRTQKANSNSGPGDCPVCLEPLHRGSNIMAAHACGHVFHAPCIQPWLHQGDPCPVCRCTINSTFTSNSTFTPIPTSNSNSTFNSRADVPPPPRAATPSSRIDVPLLPRATTTPSRIEVPPPPRATTTPSRIDVPPPPRPAPARRPHGANSNSGLGNCPVCHEPLHGRTNINAAHACAHEFHASCIEPWLHNQGSCPVCRCTTNPTPNSNSNFDINPTSTSTPSSNSTSSPINDCPVCLEPLLVGGGDVRAAHACGHVFHSHCIDPWLHQQGSCPVCRCTVNSTMTSTSTLTPTSTSNSNSAPTFTTTSNTIGYCPVCLEPLHADSGDIRAAHACGHVFHSRCIERWVRRRGSCPVCRCTVIFNSNSDGECPVCLEPLRVGGGDVRATHTCGHMFHSRCIEVATATPAPCAVAQKRHSRGTGVDDGDMQRSMIKSRRR